jgi:hypothetical protein
MRPNFTILVQSTQALLYVGQELGVFQIEFWAKLGDLISATRYDIMRLVLAPGQGIARDGLPGLRSCQ